MNRRPISLSLNQIKLDSTGRVKSRTRTSDYILQNSNGPKIEPINNLSLGPSTLSFPLLSHFPPFSSSTGKVRPSPAPAAAVDATVSAAMQCSGEAGSDWLHRLRASRGFPTDSSLDLEQFLNRPSSDLAAAPLTGGEDAAGAPDPVAGQETPVDRPPGQDWYVLMTNVLSELFNMGGGDRRVHPRPSKVPRKQPRPRVCAVSASASVGDNCAAAVTAAAATAMSPSSAENSVAAEGRESGKDGVEAPVGGAEEEISQMGIEDWEVGSYSKTTVTVIDTSEPFWRSEKLLFRKGDDWKICNRKGSSSHWSRKRRKLQNSEKGVGTNASVRDCKALLPKEVSF